MTTYTVLTEIQSDKKLRLEIPCDLPQGPVEVVVIVQPQPNSPQREPPRWDDLYGIGKEVWKDIDALDYVRELREDRDLHQ